MIDNTKRISSWNSKGLSDENTKSPSTSDIFSPLTDYLGNKIRLKFNGSCLKQQKLLYTHSKIVNIYIVYELGASFIDDPTLKYSCLVWLN